MTSLRLAVALVALANPVLAQDYTAEQLQALFERQKQAFSAAQDSGMGQTRGLKLVTVQDVSSESAVSVQSQSSPSEEVTTTVAADPNKPLVFGQLDPELQVNLHIKFDFDSAALSASEKPKLDTLCTVLRTADINVVRIVGHTDSSGSDDYNERLSVLRAKEVARHLVQECGIASERLETVGMGERFPFNASDPKADENRRVEFQALS
ncbi:OmpA family protein [Ruegeria aquimaris]|uniref:OmpA family protein n=1 Tax=Ruegeria aquimaris TaxID=2984333 RepID=A0ABT3APZ2_9RHOB|nr:OmpA family protein [Ruegeria sp. XHP0148]MCV2890332.1 OmpA family protein [Ruegeria sp. XHP0148]